MNDITQMNDVTQMNDITQINDVKSCNVFVGMDKSNDLDHFAKLGFDQVRNYLAR